MNKTAGKNLGILSIAGEVINETLHHPAGIRLTGMNTSRDDNCLFHLKWNFEINRQKNPFDNIKTTN